MEILSLVALLVVFGLLFAVSWDKYESTDSNILNFVGMILSSICHCCWWHDD